MRNQMRDRHTMANKNKIRNQNQLKHRLSIRSRISRFLSPRLMSDKTFNKSTKSYLQIQNTPAILVANSLPDKPQARLLTLQNDDPFPELAAIQASDSYTKCKLRSGYLALVVSGVDDSPYAQLQSKPIYVESTPQILTLYQNQNPDSIIKAINSADIGYAVSPSNWNILNCFQVLTKKLPEEVTIEIEALDIDETATSFVSANPYKENVLLNLCADSQAHKASWLQALAENTIEKCPKMKDVEIEVEVPEEDPNKQLDDSQTMQREKNYSLENSQKDKANEEINQKVKTIEVSIEQQEQYEAQLQREADKKLKSEQAKTNQLLQQKMCLEKILQIQREQEEENQLLLENDETNAKTVKKLDQTQENVISGFHGLDAAIQRENEKLLKQEILRQEQIKADMAQAVTDTEKDDEAETENACTNPELEKNPDPIIRQECASHIQKEEIHDQYQLLQCLRKDKYCDICCQKNIGDMFVQKIINCVTKCKSFVQFDSQDKGGFILSYVPGEQNQTKFLR